MAQPTLPASIPAIIYYPANQLIITSIYDPATTYSAFAQQLVLDLHKRCKLFPLLLAIHPVKLTAYKLLFGGDRAIIVKPTWNDPNVLVGCVDVNVFLRYREGGESFIDTPDISILRTLPVRYTRKEDDGQSVEMDMLFYRIGKCSNATITPYLRTDDMTKLITLKDDAEGRGCDSAAVKDWNVDNEDSTLLSVWVFEFERTDEEKAIERYYMEERRINTCARAVDNEPRISGMINDTATMNSQTEDNAALSKISNNDGETDGATAGRNPRLHHKYPYPDGKSRRVPPGWTFPHLGLKAMYQLWHCGDEGNGIPPIKQLNSSDVHHSGKRDRTSLYECRKIMTTIDKGAVAAGYTVATEALTHEECNTYYFHGERAILEHIPPKTPTGRVRIVDKMKWSTISREFYSKKIRLSLDA